MPNLRQYQLSSVESLRQGFKEGHKRQVLCAATGAGKSIIAVHIIKATQQNNKSVMFICDRRILVDQFSTHHLDKFGIRHGVIMSRHERYSPSKDVQVCSVQTLEKIIHEEWPKVDLIIIDEVHSMMRKYLVEYLKKYPDVKVIGLTATPFNPELSKQFSSVTNVITMNELVDQGFLVPFRVFAATPVNTNGLKVVAGEWKADDLESEALKVVGNVVEDYKEIIKLTGKRKTICFSAGVAHGTELSKQFNEAGFNFIQLSYQDSEEFKQQAIKEFSKPDSGIDGLISTDILTKGFDAPIVGHVILARPLRKSFTTHVQMVGRGARIYEAKEDCVIQCNSGNWFRFSEPFDELFHEGVKSLLTSNDKKLPKEPTEKEKKDRTCPRCKMVWTTYVHVCPTCGFAPEKKATIEVESGVMQEVTKPKEKYSSEYKERFFRQLLGYSRNKNYSDGYAFHKYIEKFGIQPAWKKIAEEPGHDVLNYIKHLAIKKSYSKGR